MNEEMINIPMTREELRLLASILNNGVLPNYLTENYGEEATFVRRLVNAKAGNTVKFDERLLRRLGMWKEPTQEDGE